ncbi:hypothetical protein EW146_g9356 [Bondarzewia mesenterica]|uniref:Uncharacterized protein n=1 Tax=Bondarzewia mesenterica TaxID=1095465 RepID=A0A4S4L7K5_9AGAM|nr:hypothetical protein EW146_g9356 [Bondarzewia mesenterica]
MPIKKKRRVKPTSPRDASTSKPRASQNCYPLPNELLHNIIASALGDWYYDLILYSKHTVDDDDDDWDAILVLLHVSRKFRECMIKLLHQLWGESFIDNPMKQLQADTSIYRRLSRVAHHTPADFFMPSRPKIFQERSVRRPLSPITRLWTCMLKNIAGENAYVQFLDWAPHGDIYCTDSLDVVRKEYDAIPAGVRYLLLERVMRHAVVKHALWLRLDGLKRLIEAVFRMVFFMTDTITVSFFFLPSKLARLFVNHPLTLLVILSEKKTRESRSTTFDGALPTPSEIRDWSIKVHASVARKCGVAVEDLPEVTRAELVAVGLSDALELLDIYEMELAPGTETCQLARDCLAIHLTEKERSYLPLPRSFYILLAAKIICVASTLVASGSSTSILIARNRKKRTHLPVELLPTIAAMVVGDYLCELILLPQVAKNWDAVMTLLHASPALRGTTFSILCNLYGESLKDGKTKALRDYKQTVPVFRRLSSAAHDTPEAFVQLSTDLLRRPSAPVVKVCLSVLSSLARENACFKDPKATFASIVTATGVKKMRKESRHAPRRYAPRCVVET